MGERAVAYVRSLGISDEQAERVFLLLAQRTQYDDPKDSRDTPMGILLNAVDVPRFAAHLGLLSEEFCQQLRGLKQLVRMDVLEHRDGSWEIVYGPSYTDHAPRAPRAATVTDQNVCGIHAFFMPGWDKYSTWGRDQMMGCLYAQIIHNNDDQDAEPRIWITPPRYAPQTIDELARHVTDALNPYQAVPLPVDLVKKWLTEEPLG
ncbi:MULTISPECIES: hypothetical protein [Kitasatospora]|uniref:Uncharacterized protein n=1 Tax=Kitasatospora setae (strain ATCC 33774 / DSM 43861 / JCM 3304 / KCC A-0304 / NBRC 14216 / KM-6054) TaxID=452652 RepID=E4NDL4_KITSK|nr:MULTISPECIES: hypothetical protein [Kitasatospora]BAJ29295.1 hypothetical protein KSE_34880 [Kitasatospora setae KM-6054]